MSWDLEIFIDGACKGNPGEAAIGVLITQNGRTLKEIAKAIGKATNNIAEYTALIYALQEALILKAQRIQIFTDSELLASQVAGRYQVKNEKLKSLFDQYQHLKKGFAQVDVVHVLREKNKDADRLASQVFKKQTKMAASLF